MLTPTERLQHIRAKLEQAFAPTHLEIIDESHEHIGHAGSKDGAGHFALVIASHTFSGKSLLTNHRLIYTTLDDLMGKEIHALTIKIIA